MENNLTALNNSILNIYENVHLFFYSYFDGNLNILLNSKVEEENYQEFDESTDNDKININLVIRFFCNF